MREAPANDGELHHPGVGIAAAALLLVGLGLRLYYATATHLNPDEAMHVNAALSPTFALAMERAWDHSHPPLLILLLHCWLQLGSTPLMARLPLIVADLLTLVAMDHWLRRRWGDSAGLIGLAFLVASPAAIAVGSEVRQFGLALCFTTLALVCLERACRRGVRWIAPYSLCLAVAISAHFGAAWLLVACGLYAPARLYSCQAGRRLWLSWMAGQVVVLAWSSVLYASNRASSGFFFHPEFLMPLLYEPGRDTPLGYVVSHTWAAMLYLGGNPPLAILLSSAGLAGIVRVATDRGKRRADLLWLLLPLGLGIVGGLTRQMPFGGSRHVAYLLPGLAAALGIGLAATVQRRAATAVATVLVLTWATTAGPANQPTSLPSEALDTTLRYLDEEVPAGADILVDRQTYELLRYAWRERTNTVTDLGGSMRLWTTERRRVFVDFNTWILQPRAWRQQIVPLLQLPERAAGQRPWVVTAGWPRLPQFPYERPPHLVRGYVQFGTFRIAEIEPDAAPPP